MTSTALKILALILMLIDHIGEFIPGTPIWLRWIGRLSAPVFIFCMVWGYTYTRNKKNYMIRLYLFSVGMAVINYLLNSYSSRYEITNNIFSTLFATTEVISILEYRRENKKRGFYYVIVFFLVQMLLAFSIYSRWYATPIYTLLGSLTGNIFINEGMFLFVALGVFFYYTKENRLHLTIGYISYCILLFINTAYSILPRIGAKVNMIEVSKDITLNDLVLFISEGFIGVPALHILIKDWEYVFFGYFQWMMVGALPLILLYNGKRGANLKWFFYIFYPLHIYLLWWIGGMLNITN